MTYDMWQGTTHAAMRIPCQQCQRPRAHVAHLMGLKVKKIVRGGGERGEVDDDYMKDQIVS
jgi:hypothetical protein